ncbi:MAG: glycerophosphodiester phosphodiesterase [Victivallaceae bacterium]|nr:glycerophosphodiester phosphodiesterase [Victivallaceae bacterium]
MTTNRLRRTALAFLAVGWLTGCGEITTVEPEESVPPPRPIKLVAHRGESANAPENTVPSYRLAWRNGACWGAETDVYLTRDNVLVCNHDPTTDRTARHPGNIREMTFADLRRLDVGKWKSPMWTGVQIPTLREVLETVPPDKHVFVEIKSAGDGFAAAYSEAMLGSGVRDNQVTIISFSGDELRNVRRALPHVRTLLLTSVKRGEDGKVVPSAEELIATLRELDVTGVDLYPAGMSIDAEYVKAVHDAGYEFHVWTFNTVEAALPLWEMGVDSITTDCSGKLHAGLEAALAAKKELDVSCVK